MQAYDLLAFSKSTGKCQPIYSVSSNHTEDNRLAPSAITSDSRLAPASAALIHRTIRLELELPYVAAGRYIIASSF